MCSVKRENNSIVLSSNNVILDIEGTTTSITFVKDVLFPYVRKHLEAYVKENWDSEGFQAIVNALRIQAKEDKENKLDGVVDIPEDCEKDDLAKAVIENILWQMDLDSKSKSLKDLQGLIMEIGYKKGELKGHVYEDVEPNLKLWTELGKAVYIYSSGSIHAQKLLYGHSEKGDLLPHIKGHFDTTVGKKGDAESYKKIVEQISGSPSETVFFTDVPKEAKAAKEAGLLAILLSREGNAPLTDEDKKEFQVVKSFSEIQFENNSKKRKVCTDNAEKNDNKSVESCEVSLKTPKELTLSTLIQQPDVNMEVEESSTEERNCYSEKSDEKLTSETFEDKKTEQNVSSENDVEMKSTSEVSEGSKSEKGDNVVDVQTNDDIVPKEAISQELKIKNNEQYDQNKKENEDEPTELLEKCQEKVDPIVERSEPENPGNEPITDNESQPCKEKTCLKASQDIKEPSQDIISENDITQDQTVNADFNTQTQHNGDLMHDSTNETQDKSKSNNTCTEKKSDIEVVMKKSSEKHDNKEIMNPDINGEGKNQSKLDILNDSNPHTNENGLIDGKKPSESSKVFTNGNCSVNSKATNSSENDMELDEKSHLKEIINSDDVMSNTTSPQDVVLPMDLDGDTDKPDTVAVEKPEIIETETVKEITTCSESVDSTSRAVSNSDVKVKDNLSSLSEAKTTGDAISENIQSDANKPEEISSEPNKQIGIEVNAAKTDDIDTNSKPCVEATVDKSLLETSSKPQNVVNSNSDQAKSGKMEMDEVNIQMNKKIGEVDKKDKSDNELCTRSEKESKLSDSELNTNVDLEKKAVSTILTETQNQSGNNDCSRQNRAEPCVEEKDVITNLSQTTDEKLTKESDCHLNAKEAIAASDMKNDINDDLSQLGKIEETIMPLNGKLDDNSKSIECGDDKELKNEIESSVCEVKKSEVSENTAIAAVVEA